MSEPFAAMSWAFVSDEGAGGEAALSFALLDERQHATPKPGRRGACISESRVRPGGVPTQRVERRIGMASIV